MRLPVPVRWLIWAAVLVLLCTLAGLRMAPTGPLDTNVFDLLPDQQDSTVLARANQRSHEAFSRHMLVLVRGPQTDATRHAARAAQALLHAAGLQAADGGDDIQHALQLFGQHAHAFLTPKQQSALREQGPNALAEAVVRTLARPAGGLPDFADDPTGSVGRFVSHLPRPYPAFTPDSGMMTAQQDGQRLYLLRLQADRDAFDADSAERVTGVVQHAADRVHDVCDQCLLQATGAPLFADAARQEASQEATWLTIASTVLIFVLIAVVFRSVMPHVLGFVQLLSSVVAAAAAVIAVFGSMSILTLVFGTTLLGIAIDYVFLYFSEYWFGRSSPQRVMPTIRGGLLTSLATAVAAFAFLLLTGFPALAQIAVFSTVGLLEAGLVVALLFPVVLTRQPQIPAHALVRWPSRLIALARRPSRWRVLLPLALLLAAVPGWFQLTADDDIRNLSYFPPQLVQTDQQIRQTLGRFPTSGYYLIRAPDMTHALHREQQLFDTLNAADADLTPLGLSRFLPPPAQQRASLALWHHVMQQPRALRQAFVQAGLPPALADHLRQQWQQAPQQPVTVDALRRVVPQLDHFIVPTDDGVALMAHVFGSRDIDHFDAAVAAKGITGVQYVDSLQRIADIFSRVRVHAIGLVAIGYVVIFALLLWRYGRRRAWRMLYPSLLALGMVIGLLGWLGIPVNVFVVVALILILGLSRDYAIFLHEIGPRTQAATLAVTLSAITTLFSFGLLMFSRIPALHAFGLATGAGILASYLLTPLALPPDDGTDQEDRADAAMR